MRVFFREGQTNDLALIPSYEPFRTTEEDCVMVMEVDDTLHPVPKEQRSRIRVFDTGNGDTAVGSAGGWWLPVYHQGHTGPRVLSANR